MAPPPRSALNEPRPDAAYATKFRHRKPEPSKLPTVTWINEPGIEDSDTQKPS